MTKGVICTMNEEKYVVCLCVYVGGGGGWEVRIGLSVSVCL